MLLSLPCLSASQTTFTVEQGSTFTLSSDDFTTLDVPGTIAINGTLEAGKSEIKVGQRWEKATNGKFDYGVSTVTFYTTVVSTLTGQTTFYCLRCDDAGKELQFTAGTTQWITNTFTMTGGVGSTIKLRSTNPASKWAVTFNSTQTVRYIDVKDSDANMFPVGCNNSQDTGNNNENWVFPPNNPSGLTQLDGYGNVLASMQWTASNLIISSFTLSTPNPNNVVKYHLEITSVTTIGGAPDWTQLWHSTTSVFLPQGTTNYQWPTLIDYGTYWWQISCENELGDISLPETNTLGRGGVAKLGFGANIAPNAPSGLTQLEGSTGNVLVSMKWTQSSIIISSFTLSDPNQGQLVKYHLQVTSVSVNGVAIGQNTVLPDWSGNLFVDYTSALTSQGTTTYQWPALTTSAAGYYWWRVWCEDPFGQTSSTSTELKYTGSSSTACVSFRTLFDPVEVEPGGSRFGLMRCSLAWGDCDNDGNLEFAVAGDTGTSNSPRALKLFKKGTGDTFTVTNIDSSGFGLAYCSIAWGDYDNDGNLDLAVAGSDNASTLRFRIYKGNGDGTFAGYIEPQPGWGVGGNNYCSLAWGDYNNDGNLDIAITGNDTIGRKFRIYKNNGDGTFNSTPIQPGGSTWGLNRPSVAWGDYDNDGDLDLMAAGSDGTTRRFIVYRNNGNNTFTEVPDFADQQKWGMSMCSVAWADYDNDGNLDIAVAGDDNNNGGSGIRRFRIIKNNGDGTFNQTPITPAGADDDWGVRFCCVAWGDFNNDGNLDIAVVGASASESIGISTTTWFRVYINQGDGTFDSNAITPEPGWGLGSSTVSGPGSPSIVCADYDNDGDVDIAVAGGDRGSGNVVFRIYKNMTSEMGNVNAAPTAVPSSAMSARFDYGTNQSTITFKWNPGQYDVGHSSYSIYYNIVVATVSIATSGDGYRINSISPSTFTITWDCGSPLLGNYNRPPVKNTWIDDSEYRHGLIYSTNTANMTNKTYHWRVQAIDAGLKESQWSQEQMIYTSIPPDKPSGLTQLNGLGSILPSMAWTTTNPIVSSFTLTHPEGKQVKYHIQITTVTTVDGVAVWTSTWASKTSSLMSQGTTCYNWPTLTEPTTHWWRVWAEDSSGVTSSTATLLAIDGLTAKLGFEVPPNAPSGLTQLEGSTGNVLVSMKWTQSSIIISSFTLSDPNAGQQVRYHLQITSMTTSVGTADWSTIWHSTDSALMSQGTTCYQWPTLTASATGYYWWRVWCEDSFGYTSSTSTQLRYTGSLSTACVSFRTAFDPVEIEPQPGWGVFECSLAWGDYDNDGDLDLAVAGLDNGNVRRLRVYKNNGNGTFDLNPVDVSGSGWGVLDCSLAWGDYNNDGYLDLAVTGQDNNGNVRRFKIYKNNGNGTFDPNPICPGGTDWGVGEDNCSVVWGDYNNDGNLDIAIAGDDNVGDSQFRVYKNNGDGTFAPNPIYPGGPAFGLHLCSLMWGDYDNDGDLDIAVAGNDDNGAIFYRTFRIYKNNGNGTFDPNPIYPNGSDTWGVLNCSLAQGDFDNDGDLDIAIVGDAGGGVYNFRIYKNNGDGTFSTTYTEPEPGWGVSWCSLACGDYDNDGYLDLAVGGCDSNNNLRFRIYRNNGDGTFSPNEIEPEPGWGTYWRSSLEFADYDNDGDLDIAVAGCEDIGIGANTMRFRIYKNMAHEMGNTNAAPTAVPSSAMSARFDYGTNQSTITFKWNPDQYDVGRSSYSLYYNIVVATVPIATSGDGYRINSISPSTFTITWDCGSPLLGSYNRPPVKNTWTDDSEYRHGLIYSTTTANMTNKTYRWRVQAIDAGLKEGPWSDEQMIQTYIPPDKPSGLTQLNGLGSILPSMAWTTTNPIVSSFTLTHPEGKQVKYHIQITTVTTVDGVAVWTSTWASKTSSLMSQGTTCYNWPTLTEPTTHWWRVWAEDSSGVTSSTATLLAIDGLTAKLGFETQLSVNILLNNYNFGEVSLGTSTETVTAFGLLTSSIQVQNDGNVTETFSLRCGTATEGSPWYSIETSSGYNNYLLKAVFHPTKPSIDNIEMGDVISDDEYRLSQTVGGGGRYTVNGDQTGVNVIAGQIKDIWLRLDMPTSSATAAPQQIILYIRAEESP